MPAETGAVTSLFCLLASKQLNPRASCDEANEALTEGKPKTLIKAPDFFS